VSPFPIFPGAQSAQGAFVPLATYKTVVGDRATITFNNIPQLYQDLFFVVSGGSGIGGVVAGGTIYVNNQGNNTTYTNTSLSGNGSTTSSSRTTAPYGFTIALPTTSLPSSIVSSTTAHILNYTNTYGFKNFMNRTALDSNGTGSSVLSSQVHTLTPAVTRLDFVCSGGWYPHTTFALYGVRSLRQ